MAFTGGSAAALVLGPAGETQPLGQAVFGPCLHEQMGGEALVAALNAWGSARDREALALRADLAATQAGVAAAFEQAQACVSATLLGIIEAFRAEAETMRQHAGREAQQSLARLEQVVAEARARFGEQDGRFAAGLGELAQRLQVVDAWAQAEPARVAAIVHAAPVPPWLSAPVPLTPPRAHRPADPSPIHI